MNGIQTGARGAWIKIDRAGSTRRSAIAEFESTCANMPVGATCCTGCCSQMPSGKAGLQVRLPSLATHTTWLEELRNEQVGCARVIECGHLSLIRPLEEPLPVGDTALIAT
jgi:hypothetical protein